MRKFDTKSNEHHCEVETTLKRLQQYVMRLSTCLSCFDYIYKAPERKSQPSPKSQGTRLLQRTKQHKKCWQSGCLAAYETALASDAATLSISLSAKRIYDNLTRTNATDTPADTTQQRPTQTTPTRVRRLCAVVGPQTITTTPTHHDASDTDDVAISASCESATRCRSRWESLLAYQVHSHIRTI